MYAAIEDVEAECPNFNHHKESSCQKMKNKRNLPTKSLQFRAFPMNPKEQRGVGESKMSPLICIILVGLGNHPYLSRRIL